MSKKKRKHMNRALGTDSEKKTPSSGGDVVTGPDYPSDGIKWYREAVEGLVVAIVLALLIRGFEAEAFVIPTGSMAPTLVGRHKDVQCKECGHEYPAGASSQIEARDGTAAATVCPICCYPQELKYDEGRDASFAGDRIIVNKFAYDPLGEPERFDVIVFKNPNDAKQNYIKRLCGLPGETIKLTRGDIYASSDATGNKFRIARKPTKKLRALLQLVDDTDHVSPRLQEAGMPPAWQPEANSAWTANETHQKFTLAASAGESWMRYRNYKPRLNDWTGLKQNSKLDFSGLRPGLIVDTNPYNGYYGSRMRSFVDFSNRYRGKNWVGDLAVETKIDVQSDSGELLLDLVEGGWHFRCTIDVSTGAATLSITDPQGQPSEFVESNTVTAATAVKGKGTHEILFSNFDTELRVSVDGKPVTFDKPTAYSRGSENEHNLRPFYGGPENPGDLAPVGVGGKGIAANVERTKVYRDIYYVADDTIHAGDCGDYQVGRSPSREQLENLFHSPEQWAETSVFDRASMKEATFPLKDFEDDSRDQFFPMGDNSTQSLDGRLWDKKFVERQLLIGEAVFIYYPHPWAMKTSDGEDDGEGFKSIPLIVYPKFSRMGIIR